MTTAQEQPNKMKVEIWSDVVCPWCYIGKRRFEAALEEFEYADHLDIEWKSYQLDPEMETDTSVSIAQYLADKKGMSIDQAEEMMEHVSGVAANVGLEYHLDQAIPINTYQAHSLLHYAKSVGKQGEMKERIMKAYFTESKNLDDKAILVALAKEVGLDTDEVTNILENKTFHKAVKADIMEAYQLGLRGVPFFVIERKYGISGAQETKVFLQSLEKAYEEWIKENPQVNLETIDGKICKPDGSCD